MDRIYVKHNDKAPVHQLGLDLWRDCVVRRRDTRERLLLLLLGNVRKERQGEVIDRALMRSITMVRTDLPTHRVQSLRHRFLFCRVLRADCKAYPVRCLPKKCKIGCKRPDRCWLLHIDRHKP